MKHLMTLVVILLLAGCAAGQGGAGRTPAEETTANGAEETTIQEGAGDLKRPPDSKLSYGGQEVIGVLGSYCWGNMCADSVFIVPPHKMNLTVPSGSDVVFHYGGQDSTYRVEGARAYPLSQNGTSTASAESNRSLKVHGSGVERAIPVELPPGEYVVDVFIREPKATRGYNDAVYYFRIMVE